MFGKCPRAFLVDWELYKIITILLLLLLLSLRGNIDQYFKSICAFICVNRKLGTHATVLLSFVHRPGSLHLVIQKITKQNCIYIPYGLLH